MISESAPSRPITRTVLSLSALALLVTGAGLFAGPLDPPAGPVAPTHKTLTEVEPRIAINAVNTPGDADSLYKITQPGSYYLTGNINGVAGKHGIEIVASGVTLDLNGFELKGVVGSIDGIAATVGLNDVEVRDGRVVAWGGDGLNFTNGGAITLTDLRVASCGEFGVAVGPRSILTRCIATSNTAGGFATGTACVVQSCVALGNLGSGGILAFVDCTVIDCAAMTNAGSGISAGNGSTITGCSSADSTGSGFSVVGGCTISDCTALANDMSGFAMGAGSAVHNSAALSNFGAGISAGEGCTVNGCTVRDNRAGGISASNFANISSCTAQGNVGAAIAVGNRCVVLANQCEGTIAAPVVGTKGIFVTGTDCRIESNHLSGLERGLHVTFAGNLIIRNSASGNTTNWDISATNFGQFVIATNSGAAFAGSAGGTALGSTDPWVNFSY